MKLQNSAGLISPVNNKCTYPKQAVNRMRLDYRL